MEGDIPDKLPPQAPEAEKAVLGSMLIERHAVELALEQVAEKHFYSEANRAVFRAIAALHHHNQAADLITVSEELKRMKLLDTVGGSAYLSQLTSKVSSAAHVEHYAKIVRDKATLRELIQAGSRMVSRAFGEERDVGVLTDEAEKSIFEIRQQSTSHSFVGAADLAHDVIEQIGALAERKAVVTGVGTGFKMLDEMTGGFQKEDLIILAARPSQGKTALALNFASHAALNLKTPTAIFSLEMSRHSIMMRFVCAEARADLGKVRRGYFKREIWPELTNAAARFEDAPLFIDDSTNLSVLEVRSRARRLASKLAAEGKQLGLVMIDYMQLMRGSDGARREGRQQEVAEISRGLKGLARDLKCPVIALSQLSRRVEEKGREGRPMLSDLRESGSIEQDADLVMFIYREGIYKPEERDNEELQRKAELIIAKQRNGPTDAVPLNFFREFTRFENPAFDSESAAPEQATF